MKRALTIDSPVGGSLALLATMLICLLLAPGQVASGISTVSASTDPLLTAGTLPLAAKRPAGPPPALRVSGRAARAVPPIDGTPQAFRAEASAAGTPAPTAAAASADTPAAAVDNPGAAGGPVTVSGSGDFADLKVTVSKTADLVDQYLRVTWEGATPTNGGPPLFVTDYLQLMQCWGDDPQAPDFRTQCQYGGDAYPLAAWGGKNVVRREVSPENLFVDGKHMSIDPAEPLTLPNASGYKAGYDVVVPFHAADGTSWPTVWQGPPDPKQQYGKDNAANPYFNRVTTNEIPFAKTDPNGRGAVNFEVQTVVESSGLGCGAPVDTGPNKGLPRRCWLVVVPRGHTEVDGQPPPTGFEHAGLQSSPLSWSNWKNRVNIPLDFRPLSGGCPVGTIPSPIVGNESVGEAIRSWEPALCPGGGPVFSYAAVSEASVDSGLFEQPEPLLAMTSTGISTALAPPDRKLVYAPIALSGLTVVAVFDRRPSFGSAGQETGNQILDINLTPRLVAKLLTQSYVSNVYIGSSARARYLGNNPLQLTEDPDFLAVNSTFSKDHGYAGVEFMLPGNRAAINSTIWQWIAQDQDARDFVAGVPDQWGMRVNPFYQAMSFDQTTFPVADPYCLDPLLIDQTDVQQDTLSPPIPWPCQRDLHPRADNLSQAAQLVARADPRPRTKWKARAVPTDPGGWGNPDDSRQNLYQRGITGMTDTSLAQRYALVTAKLRNASGNFVAPAPENLLAGAAQLRPGDVPGVQRSDPARATGNAYPLVVLTYATTAPAKLSVDRAKAYAEFIRYAITSGQTPGSGRGSLPAGYAPLPYSLRQQALAAAAAIQSRVGSNSPPSTTEPTQDDSPGSDQSGTDQGGDNSGGDAGAGPGVTPPALAPPAAALLPAVFPVAQTRTPPSSAGPSAGRLSTPAELAGLARFAVIVALILGVLASIAGPFLPRIAQSLKP